MKFLQTAWINELMWTGDDGLTEYTFRNSKPIRGKGTMSDLEQKITDEVNSRCRIYFPSLETVVESKGGAAVRIPCFRV